MDEQHIHNEKPVQGQNIAQYQQITQIFHGPQDTAISPTKTQRVWNVPYQRNPHFTGRDELLDQLAQQLAPEAQAQRTTTRRAALTQPQAIKGLGGIGKTQIAIEYAYRSRDLGRYTHTFWTNAASEEALLTSFVELAELLPVFPAKGETDQHRLVEAVKRWLELCQERWLLIFDNADDVSLVRNFLPQNGKGSILLTTRAQAAGSIDASSIEVENMGLREGTEFLLHRAQCQQVSDEEQDEATNIAVALDCFPLALDQAGAYIEETRCSFTDYLALYQNHRQALLAQRGTLATDYPNSVATTWSLSFQKVQQANPAAAELLQLCAFLAPDRIPEELLTEGAIYWPPLLQKASADLFAFQQMIAELLKFSLVKRLVEDRTLSIHRLVQAVQRDRMETEAQRQWAERVVRALDTVFPHNSQDPATWPQCLRYLDQIHACHRLIEHYMLYIVEAADLLNRAGLYLNKHALYAIAKLLYQSALAIREQVLGADHPDTATILNNLAGLYDMLGQDHEAEQLYQRALVIQEQKLGTMHPETARSLSNLAALYQNQGKYMQAEPLEERALVIREQTLGPMHPDTAGSLHRLATLCWRQGKFAEAEPLYQRALAIREHILGPTHPDVALSVNNLAVLYWNMGKYEQAELFYQRALSIWEQMYGPTHPHVALSLNSLAELHRLQGEYQEAERLYRRALSIWEQMYGPHYLDAALSLHGLAKLYSAQNNSSQAERLYRQALSIRTQALEPAHPDVLSVLEDYMALLRRMNRSEEATERKAYAEAELLYQRALQIREQQLGPEHSDVASPLNGLANLYRDQGRYAEAEPLYQRALQIREQRLGPEHSDVAETIHDLAQFWEMQDNNEKAKSLYTRALAVREQALGVQHPKTIQTRQNYITLLRAMGCDKEARQFERDNGIQQRQSRATHGVSNVLPLVSETINRLCSTLERYRKQKE
jgi:tetratricopeptide (TPR) repeat protein